MPEQAVLPLLNAPVAIWLARDADELKPAARRPIQPAGAVFASSASRREASIKVAWGKLPLQPRRSAAQLPAAGVEHLPVSGVRALAAHPLPRRHQDPSDRLRLAPAMSEPMPLLTHDSPLLADSPLVIVH